MQFDIQSSDREPLAAQTRVALDGKYYVIDQLVGQGGFALLYLAHREGDSHRVAIKELYPRRSPYGIVYRSESGKITILDPFTGEADRTGIWDELISVFEHEVKMAKRASQVYGEDGTLLPQNNRDVLDTSGPFQDERGNWYVLIDTAQGTPFSDLIQKGWIKEGDRVVSNGYLKEILAVLIGVARRLSVLHHSNYLLHLDLSPGNIYLVSVEGGTELRPHIIDYGSAMDCKNPPSGHRYTVNPFSAPEISALADLDGGPSTFYQADESSDTYSLVNILYYALTGEVYSALSIFDRSWQERITNEYAFDCPDGKRFSFADKLIDFLRKGLSADRSKRFCSADELCKELEKLAAHLPDLLGQLSDSERMSSVLLDRWPLYRFRDEAGNIHVLCLGSGEFVFRMVLSMISVGQMLDGRLYIHVVSADADNLRARLRVQAPTLEQYSNLVEGTELIRRYVDFTFETVNDLTDEICCTEVCERYAQCRYVVVSLGSNQRNTDAGRMAAKAFSAAQDSAERVVLYYNEEDAARNTRGTIPLQGIQENVHLIGFGEHSSRDYSKALRNLGRSALRLSHLYKRLYDPRLSLRDSAKEFMLDGYSQRSSVSSALHLPYKLASLGIDPGLAPAKVISAYFEALKTHRDQLLVLEHRRWLMYMIAEGYRKPTMEDLEAYAFRNGNAAFKNKDKLLHHCLAPFEDGTRKLSQLSHDEWDRYDASSIESAPYEEFDKMSLRLHLLAKEIAQGKVGGSYPLMHDCQELERYIIRAESLDQQYLDLKEALSDLQRSPAKPSAELEKLDLLEAALKEQGIGAEQDLEKIRFDLKVYQEYGGYKDYKESDEKIVAYLPWLLYADRDLSLVKLCGRTLTDDLLAPLLLEPSQLIYYGAEDDERMDRVFAFLGKHGLRCKPRFHRAAQRTELEAVIRRLEQLCMSLDNCVIDGTGCQNELHLAAAVMLAQRHPEIALICCNEEDQSVTNIIGFDAAPVYRLKTSVSAEEAFALYGAESDAEEKRYMRQLYAQTEQFWSFYQQHKRDWQQISAFFGNYGAGSAELYLPKPLESKTVWKSISRAIPKSFSTRLNLEESLRSLAEQGYLRNLRFEEQSEFVNLYFEYPSVFASRIYRFLEHLPFTLAPFRFFMDSKNDAGMLQSGSFVLIMDAGFDYSDHRQSPDLRQKVRFKYRDIIPALQELEKMGLIREFEYGFPPEEPSGKYRIQFYYTSMAAKELLAVSGNVLEAMAWRAAKGTGRFDDCRPNFFFQWKGASVTNELDLILTRGLTTMIVSCKTAKYNKQHLYEVRYLADRFSLGSKAVILYSSDLAVDDNGRLTRDVSSVKERARAMGVYLIDMNALSETGSVAERLGAEFVRILEDKDTHQS